MSYQLGKATLHVFNIGEIYLPLVDHMNISKADLVAHEDAKDFVNQTRIPIQFFCIQLPHTTVLVDAGIYDTVTHPNYAIADYTPPPSLIEQLSQAGIALDTIEHVVITHRHWDHFNGTTVLQDGVYVPRFPNARYYLGQADWERASDLLQDPESIESRTLKILDEQNILTRIDTETEIVDGVHVIPASGETRGHQIVRIESDGNVLYCLGDLYHHQVELVHADWMVAWARQDPTLTSRHMLMTRAIPERALLVATHIVGMGRLTRTDQGIQWDVVS